MNRYALICCFLLVFRMAPGAELNDSTSNETPVLRYEDIIYSPTVKTALLNKAGTDLSSPIIELNGTDKLNLSFDEIDADLQNYYYTFVHCDALWQPSNMISSDYIDGYSEDRVVEYKYSFNTLQKYIHYSLVFPNDIMKPVKSGNYIIKVFLDNDPSKLVLSKRFMVVDPRIGIEATVRPSIDIYEKNKKQEVNFVINHKTYNVGNPYGDVKVVLQQNGKWHNCINNLKPLFVKENQLIYNYTDGNRFNGGNEFRIMDIRSLRFQTEHIARFDFDSLRNNHVYLTNDDNRSSKRYTFYNDINGKFLVKTTEGHNSELESDYTFVHFNLPLDGPISKGKIYVYGGLSNWTIDPRFMMEYNPRTYAYEGIVYLKQGYYNYQYVIVNDQNKVDDTFFEGSFGDTENDYVIYVYHRGMGDRYDKLIGVKHLNTLQGY